MTTENTFNPFPAASLGLNEPACCLILENIQEGFILVDPQLKVVYFNQAAQEGTRRFLNTDLYQGMYFMDLIQPKRKPYVHTIYTSVLQGQTHVTETSFIEPGGKVVFYKNSFFPAFNENKEITGVIVTSKNITENKSTEQAIKDSEERLQFALEATHQGAWDWNLQTNEVIFSSSYKKLYGFADNELKNHVSEWMSRIHPDDQKKMENSVEKHLLSADPVLISQYRIRGKDGRYRWVQAKGLLIRNEAGAPVRMIGTHTDITDSLEKELKLKQFHERFDCIMKATNELLWEWDIENGRFFRSEDGLRKVFGMTDNSSLQKIENWLQRLHPDDRQRASDMVKEVLEAPHQFTFEMEYRFCRDDGEYNYIYDRGILMRDEDNKPVRVIGSAQDISERKRLEKEILQNELAYQRLVHQATIDSQENERAEIGKELHDNVNQVLTTTKLYLDLAQTNAELREDLLVKSVKNINSVIQEIRQLSRSLMDPSIDDLGLLYSLNDLIENIHLTQKLKVQLAADETIESALDPKQKLALFRIIQESLNNSLRHANASLVTISLFLQNGQLHTLVQDNGIGFQKENIKKGAGLKNIQNRIYLINGTLQMESMPNKGCTLHIQFPVK